MGGGAPFTSAPAAMSAFMATLLRYEAAYHSGLRHRTRGAVRNASMTGCLVPDLARGCTHVVCNSLNRCQLPPGPAATLLPRVRTSVWRSPVAEEVLSKSSRWTRGLGQDLPVF